MRPLRIGDAHGVVVEITLDRDGLEWLAWLCPPGDGFTEDLHKALQEVDERLAIEAELPSLDIRLVGR